MTPPSAATLPASVHPPARTPGGESPSAAAPVPPPVQVLVLAEPLPGFPGHRNFALVAADVAGLLFWFQAVAPEGPRFLAVQAAAFFPDYAPALPGPVRTELGLAGTADAQLYCLVTVPGGDVTAATANLRAPLVVNPATHRARQVVLPDGGHPIRRPLRR